MKSRLALIACVFTIASGCVSVSPSGSTAPSAQQPGGTPLPSAVPTLPTSSRTPLAPPPLATAAPTEQPSSATLPPQTASPTAAATPTAAPTPTADPDTSLVGADTPVFTDDFDDFTSGWATSADADATVEYTDGGDNFLYMLFETTAGHSVDSSRELGGEVGAVRVDATVEIGGPGTGAVGVECLDDEWDGFGGGVTTSGAYFLYERDLLEGRSVIGSEAVLVLAGTGIGDEVRLVLECSIDAEGTAEIYFSVNGELLYHQTQTQSDLGPIRRIALYGEAFAGSGTELNWIEAAVFADAEPVWDPATEALLAHVPADVATGCAPANGDGIDGFAAGVACNATGPDSSGISVFYIQYETEELMRQAHRATRDEWADNATDGGDCADGDPATGVWDIGGESLGQYVCYLDFGTPALEWSMVSLRMVATATNDDSESADGFDELWRWWEGAGPI